MKIFMRAAVLNAVALAMSSAASAELINFRFDGVYSSGVKSGQAFSGIVSYTTDSAPGVVDNDTSYSTATYRNIVSFSSLVNASQFTVQSTQLVVSDAFAPVGFYQDVYQFSSYGVRNGSGAGNDYLSLAIYQAGGGSAFSGTAPPTFAALQNSAFTKSFFNGDGSSGSVSISAIDAVPEPAAWAMLIVGFGMIGGASRYRRRSTATTFA